MKWIDAIQFTPSVGKNVISASKEAVQFGLSESWSIKDMNELLALVGNGSREDRNEFGAAIYEPIMRVVPYVELYSRFYQQQNAADLEDVLIAVEDIINIAYDTHPNAEVLFNEPGYRFTRPTWQTFDASFRLKWNTVRFAGWNLLARQLNYVTWELARKRDAAAKTAIDNAVPTSHKLTVTGGLNKASVDEVIRRSNEVGFPVRQAVVNPGRIMEMQSWNWVMPTIPDGVALELIQNLYYGSYGGVNWFASPHALSNTIYFGGAPEQVGYHWTRGDGRSDTDVDIVRGDDLYAVRDPQHSWYVDYGLSLWTITIA